MSFPESGWHSTGPQARRREERTVRALEVEVALLKERLKLAETVIGFARHHLDDYGSHDLLEAIVAWDDHCEAHKEPES